MELSKAELPGAAGASASVELLLQQAKGEARSSEQGKIEKAGHDFEAILLGSWLQGAEKSFAAAPGGDDEEEEQDSSRDQFLSMAMEQLAGSLVNAGGIGISRMIVQHLAKTSGIEEGGS